MSGQDSIWLQSSQLYLHANFYEFSENSTQGFLTQSHISDDREGKYGQDCLAVIPNEW